MRPVRVYVTSALALCGSSALAGAWATGARATGRLRAPERPERAERERDPHCSERADYEGKDFKEWLRGRVLGYVISTIFR